MPFLETTAVKRILPLKKRIRVIQGGTGAGKTIAIISILIAMAQEDEMPTLTSIVSESFPHLKRGAMRDFLNIMKDHHYYQDTRWNKTDCIYTFETGSKIEFFSADQMPKVRGPRRQRLFINEAINVPYETFDQLEIRTTDFIFMDWNPSNEFWYYDKVANRSDVDFIILTYKDNEGLDKNVVASIEQRRSNKSWWRVYGEGLLGEIETRIYKNWQIIDELPHEAKLKCYGLDYGYTNDPTAIVAIYYLNGGYIFDEIAFQKGLLNKQIYDILNNYPQSMVIADSAEPKSNDELKMYGLTVIGAKKGKDSVLNGIQFVQGQSCSITKHSVNLIKEYRNYIWITDKYGKIINEPDHQYSHSMDAIRYGMSSIEPVKEPPDVYEELPEDEPIYKDIGI